MSFEINQGWELTSSPPNAYHDCDALQGAIQTWQKAMVPGTVAQSVTDKQNLDASDWWYRCSFSVDEKPDQKEYRLRFDGLATLADIWLNGVHIFSTDNMFKAYYVDVTPLLAQKNMIVICFRSLESALQQKRPRPRWKTKLVSEQSLRWFRTTLLGRIPGWTPAIAPVGPWKGIYLEHPTPLASFNIQTRAVAGVGILNFTASLTQSCTQASLQIGDHIYPLVITETVLTGEITIPDVLLWWPHTHGTPSLLNCSLHLLQNGETVQVDCGKVGFKAVAIDRSLGRVQVRIHGQPVFCRGACWTINDFISLTGDSDRLRKSLTLARNAGVNMLRIGGTMVYETDLFYDLCDEMGIMVWQDFMFANMDYPVTDAAFGQNIKEEVIFQLGRLQKHPCLTVYCGSSEIAQQAAMMGMPEECWSNSFFSETLPTLCDQYHKGIPYFPSSPCAGDMPSQGTLPFHVGTGIAHYYGVGAYKRPITDVKWAKVKFTSETLGFSNVPETKNIVLIMGGRRPVTHHPLWKMNLPRDTDAGWDFEDIRDYYMEQIFQVNAVALRSHDIERYLYLARVTTGEVMKQVYAEWRRPDSCCGGGLVWFFKDIAPGAGWGIIDSENQPKAVYYYLKRAWAAQTIFMTDEGLDGINLHIMNESDAHLNAEVTMHIFQGGKILLESVRQAVSVSPRTAATLSADGLLKHFSDMANVYRFGPPKHDLVVARLIHADTGVVIGEDFYSPQGVHFSYVNKVDFVTSTQTDEQGSVVLTLESDCFLQAVHLEANGYTVDEDYFHLAPRHKKTVRFSPLPDTTCKFKAYLIALNMRDFVTL
jgi:beta-mannosidase